MVDIDTVRAWRGKTMVDRDGGKIGPISDIYADDQTGQPEWALVSTGLFGTKQTFVPLAQASTAGDDVQVPYEKAKVKDAPRVDPDGRLSEAEEAELWDYYGLDYGARTDVSGQLGSAGQTGARDEQPTAEPEGPTTDEAMTRSEEELRIGTTQRERGRARLRKWVETEQVQQTVPVQREEVRVEREPITDANLDDATSGPDISEAEHEVVLHEEEPVVEKRVVPKERVRLGKETVTGEEQVADEVRKEQVDVDDQGKARGRRRRR
jgi:uncharacterized protein (TIGR02271 family)